MTMTDQQNNERPMTRSELKAFLKRLGIPVNSDTIALAEVIDAEMRAGNHGAAEAAVQELIALFRATELEAFEDDGRVEHNDNALDRGTPDAALVKKALTYYENMRITLQAADPEESMGEIYSDELTNRIAYHAGLPNDPLVKPWLKRIGEAFATGGREAAADAAGGLIRHFVVDGVIEDTGEARMEMLNTIVDTVALADRELDDRGDVDGNEDFWGKRTDPEDAAQGDVEIDMSAIAEEERRARELNERTMVEANRREQQLYADLAQREGGLLNEIGLDPENEDDAALMAELQQAMRAVVVLPLETTQEGIARANAARANIEQLAARLAARMGGENVDEAALAQTIPRQIAQEATEIDRQIGTQVQEITNEAHAAVKKEMREEAKAATTPDATLEQPQDNAEQDGTPDQPAENPAQPQADDNPNPADTTNADTQKVAQAMRDNGMKEATSVAERIVQIMDQEGTLPGLPMDVIEDLLVRAQNFIAAEDAYIRTEQARHQEDTNDAPTETQDETPQDASNDDPAPQPAAEQERAPQLSDYRDEFLEISFLLAERDTDGARAKAKALAATLRALGGEFAKIDTAMVLKYVARLDKKANDARAQAAPPETDADSEVDDGSDRAAWFLTTALRTDRTSATLFEAIVTAMVAGDRQTAGNKAKELANHILQLYKTKVSIVEMVTAIVNVAKQEADARKKEAADASSRSNGNDDGPGGNGPGGNGGDGPGDNGPGGNGGNGPDGDDTAGDTDDPDDNSDRAAWFLMTAVEKDATASQLYDGLVRALLVPNKSKAAQIAKALATHILKLYKTNVTMPEMMQAIIKAARADAELNRDDASQASSAGGYDSDEDDGSEAGGVVADQPTGGGTGPTYDMSTIKRVDWESVLGVYSMDTEESEAAMDVAKLIVKKGTDSASALKSAKDLLTRSSKKVKGAKVKNHKHFVAAIEDALIKRTDNKKVVKPLKFADIPDDVSDDISV